MPRGLPRAVHPQFPRIRLVQGTLRRTSVNDLLCITAAIILATALVTMMKMLGGKENITAVISLRDLLSLSCLSLILMSGMRLIARSAYDAYIRHTTSSGAYGYNSDRLINLEMADLLSATRSR